MYGPLFLIDKSASVNGYYAIAIYSLLLNNVAYLCLDLILVKRIIKGNYYVKNHIGMSLSDDNSEVMDRKLHIVGVHCCEKEGF